MKIENTICDSCKEEIPDQGGVCLDGGLDLCRSCVEKVKEVVFMSVQPAKIRTLSVYQTHQLLSMMFAEEMKQFL